MDESLSGTIKLIGPNYSVWKSKIEEEAILGVHNIIEITQKGAWSKLEIGKTLRKILYVIIAIVQTTMKEIVGRKGETKIVEPLTTRNLILE